LLNTFGRPESDHALRRRACRDKIDNFVVGLGRAHRLSSTDIRSPSYLDSTANLRPGPAAGRGSLQFEHLPDTTGESTSTSFVNADGVRLYVEETGRGHPLVFVHELNADCREWESQVRWFSRFYRCIAFNARGYPPSDVPGDPSLYGFPLVVHDIAAVMRGLGISQAHVVGSSMGAYAALHFGLMYPGMASSLVIAGVGSGSPPADRAAFVAESEATARAYLEQGAPAVAEIAARTPTRLQLLRKNPRAFEEFLSHLREHSAEGKARTILGYQARRPSLQDYRNEFSGLEIPVLLIAGDEDEPCLETTLWLKRTLPNAGLWICPNSGHAVNLEEPAAFNRTVEDFLSAVQHQRWRR
jgi:pimeloyl-ACP methyl ester carboxylesterase